MRYLQDAYGNIKVVYKHRDKAGAIALEAHTDHPGFEVIRPGKKALVQLLGGVPDRFFAKARVVVWDQGKFLKARVVGVQNRKKRRYWIRAQHLLKKGAFGYFDLPGWRFKKNRIYTKAADDMMNVACLLNLLKELVRQRRKAHIIFLFTRAEEVGFLGALGAIRSKFLSKKIPIIVLEASNAKAGKVQIGSGPVLRVGDKSSVFSRTIDLWLQESAAALSKKFKNFHFQRALLSGGRCESTVYVEKGFQAGCLALPLGNYHNVGYKTYALEYVSLKDYQNMLVWLFHLTQSGSPKKVSKKMSYEMDRCFRRYASRLKNIAY